MLFRSQKVKLIYDVVDVKSCRLVAYPTTRHVSYQGYQLAYKSLRLVPWCHHVMRSCSMNRVHSKKRNVRGILSFPSLRCTCPAGDQRSLIGSIVNIVLEGITTIFNPHLEEGSQGYLWPKGTILDQSKLSVLADGSKPNVVFGG